MFFFLGKYLQHRDFIYRECQRWRDTNGKRIKWLTDVRKLIE